MRGSLCPSCPCGRIMALYSWGLCGDYVPLFLGAIMFLYSWGRLWPFILGDYDFFVPGGDYVSLFLGIKFLCSWGRLWFSCGDCVGIMSSSHLYLSLSPLNWVWERVTPPPVCVSFSSYPRELWPGPRVWVAGKEGKRRPGCINRTWKALGCYRIRKGVL